MDRTVGIDFWKQLHLIKKSRTDIDMVQFFKLNPQNETVDIVSGVLVALQNHTAAQK